MFSMADNGHSKSLSDLFRITSHGPLTIRYLDVGDGCSLHLDQWAVCGDDCFPKTALHRPTKYNSTMRFPHQTDIVWFGAYLLTSIPL